MPLLIFIYSMMVQLIYQYEALLTRSQYRVSDTQVTVKACRPLVMDLDSNALLGFILFPFIFSQLRASGDLSCGITGRSRQLA